MNCPNCFGNGYIRTRRAFTPATVSDCEECPECRGSGEVVGCVVCEDAEPVEGSDRCARCAGDRDDESVDDEPADIDDDRGFNPYTGASDDDGYDTGYDDYPGVGYDD